MQLDVKRMAEVVLDAVSIPLAAFAARLAAVEARQPEKGEPGHPGAKGDPGGPGAAGNGIVETMIDQDGALILVMTDGTTRNAGRVVGRDADMVEIGARVAELVKAIPAPKNGVDGLGFDDMSVEHDGERTVTLCFARGDVVKRFPVTFDVVLDRGVYRPEQTYGKGDAVSFGGSLWIAGESTGEKPGDGSTAWRLAVKRGRDGRDVPSTSSGSTGSGVRDGKANGNGSARHTGGN